MLSLGCGGPSPGKVVHAFPPEPQPVVLALLRSEAEAEILALITAGRWDDPFTSRNERIAGVLKAGMPYTLLPSLLQGSTSQTRGTLSGALRDDCGWLYLGLAAPALAAGYAVAGPASVRSLPIAPHTLEPAQAATVLEIIARATGQAGVASEQLAYQVDMNDNGKPELVVVATHPELATDFADYKPAYHSLLVVVPDDRTLPIQYAGYLHATQGAGSFRVLQLDSVADIDLDGRPELLVTARHSEGFQLLVYRYDGALNEVYHSLGGEHSCGNHGE